MGVMPPDPDDGGYPVTEEAKAKAARNSVHASSRRVECIESRITVLATPDPEGAEGKHSAGVEDDKDDGSNGEDEDEEVVGRAASPASSRSFD
ncbi:hypothetical protein FRB98_005769 [Tulasnella sp. 332]|nr:hypothetical protein FRB98_005769 [Tulasnella sp. 332]